MAAIPGFNAEQSAQIRLLMAEARPQVNYLRGLGEAPTLASTDEEAFRSWREKFESKAPRYGWTLRQQKEMAKELLTGDARAVIDEVDLHVADEAYTLEQLLNQFEALFTAGQGTVLAISRFEEAVQRESENARAWASRATIYFRKAYPEVQNPQTNTTLLNKIRNGLADASNIESLTVVPAATVNELVTAIHGREARRQQMETQARRRGGSLNQIGAAQSANPAMARQEEQQAIVALMSDAGSTSDTTVSSETREKMALCLSIGATKMEKAISSTSCYICEKTGHRMNDCPHKSNLSMVLIGFEKLARRVSQMSRELRSRPRQRNGNFQPGFQRGGPGGARRPKRGFAPSARGRGSSYPPRSQPYNNSKPTVQAVGMEEQETPDEAYDHQDANYPDYDEEDSYEQTESGYDF